MADLSLRQRSPSELIDAGFQIYRRDAAQFVAAMGLIYLPVLFTRLWQQYAFADVSQSNISVFLGRSLIGALVLAVAYAIGGGAVTALASEIYLGRPTDIGSAMRRTLPRVGTLAICTIIATILIWIGSIFLLIPALYLLARFFALRTAIIIEDAGVGEAFARTSQLSSGTKRHILNTVILAWLIVFVVYTAISAGIGYVIPSATIAAVITSALWTVFYPIVPIVYTLLYYDIRIRKEAFDLEYLAGALGADGAS